MDDNARNASSYHTDQEILDARGINMTVEEVAGLPTSKYSERVQSLRLPEADLAFLKGLRRRIKNRLASQNSRRRSMEHLRRLTRELRAVRACRGDALAERKGLVIQRDAMRDRCQTLRVYIAEALRERSDTTEIPNLDIKLPESHSAPPKDLTNSKANAEPRDIDVDIAIDTEKNIFECCIDKLVQKSVNHMFNNNNNSKKRIFAKTVFIEHEKDNMYHRSEVQNVMKDLESFKMLQEENGVLNLSVKNEGRRKSHGRKQSAPRRIAYVDYDDCVLDLKIKKEQ